MLLLLPTAVPFFLANNLAPDRRQVAAMSLEDGPAAGLDHAEAPTGCWEIS